MHCRSCNSHGIRSYCIEVCTVVIRPNGSQCSTMFNGRNAIPQHTQPGYSSNYNVDGRNPAPVDRWFIPLFMGFQPPKVMQDFATIHSITIFLMIKCLDYW